MAVLRALSASSGAVALLRDKQPATSERSHARAAPRHALLTPMARSSGQPALGMASTRSPFNSRFHQSNHEDLESSPHLRDETICNALASDENETVLDFCDYSSTAGWWITGDYLSLSMRAYTIMRSEVQHALQLHFKQRSQPRNQSHTCCAISQSLSFICGEDKAVASMVRPACIMSNGIYLAT